MDNSSLVFTDILVDGSLIGAAILFFIMAIALMMKSFTTSYNTYARSCFLSSIAYLVFCVGYLMHIAFHMRQYIPTAYLPWCISYLHIGGVLFGLSHISILAPNYFRWWRILRDILGTMVSLLALWSPFLMQNLLGMETQLSFSLAAGTWWHALLLIPFFLHCGYLALDLYIIYYRTSRSATQLSAPLIDHFVRWLLTNCHFIVFVGISSAAVMQLWGANAMAMFVLVIFSAIGFVMMFRNMMCYSYDIDSAYPTIEHVNDNEERKN